MLSSKKEIYNCDQQAKFIQERINLTEKNFVQIFQILSEYLRKVARIRDKSDEVAKIFMTFSENEGINKTLSNAVANFALSFSILGDLGHLRVKNIEAKVLSELTQYDGICKNAKEEIKLIFTVRDREITKKRQLDRIRERNPRNRQQITQAETELLRATAEVSRTIHGLEEQTNEFEKRKLHDIKQILLNFITVEIAFHAKSLEVLTKAYQEVNTIDEESDLQDFQDMRGSLDVEFRKTLKSPGGDNFKSKLSMFKSTQSLGSLNTLFTSPKKQVSISKRPIANHKLNMKDSIDSINVEDKFSTNDIETENSSDVDTPDRFLARKHKQK